AVPHPGEPVGDGRRGARARVDGEDHAVAVEGGEGPRFHALTEQGGTDAFRIPGPVALQLQRPPLSAEEVLDDDASGPAFRHPVADAPVRSRRDHVARTVELDVVGLWHRFLHMSNELLRPRPKLRECVDPRAAAVAVQWRERTVGLLPDETVEGTAFRAD